MKVAQLNTTKKPMAWSWALGIGLMLLALHLACIGGYGYFRDELYYLACSKRLDWGYVDQPPLSIALLRLFTVFGDSLWALRLPTILNGIATAWILMALTARLGGDARAQAVAGATFAAAPVYRVVNHVYSMNGLDVMFWTLSALLFVRILQDDDWKDWVWLGAVIGLALMNKLSALWLVAGLSLGFLASERRNALLSYRPYMAAGIGFLVALPHAVWQMAYGWPTLEFVANANLHKLLKTSAWQFLGVQVVVMNPATLPVWLGGTIFALRNREYRPLAVAFLTVATILILNGRARENYLAPAYPLVIAPGAIWLVEWVSARWPRRVYQEPVGTTAYFGALGASGFATACLALPLLPIHVIETIFTSLPIEPPSTERGTKSPLNGFGDMMGWQELTDAVAKVYHSIPPAERKHAAILTYNYGEAAALERFGAKVGLPQPISTHNNYYIWGPRDWDGKVAILFGQIPQSQLDKFREVREVAQMDVPLAMPEEGRAYIRLARDLKVPVKTYWSFAKRLE